MTISHTPAIERIARVLAGQRLSVNGEGEDPSAGPDVDASWMAFEDDAIAVLKTLREPDAAMAAAGDPRHWRAMVHAALGEPDPEPARTEPGAPGTDPFHEGP